MKVINLPIPLRDYMQRLQYEAVRYQDLLRTVTRDSCPMTDEEWNSSLAYYRTLSREANYSLNVAKQQITELYTSEEDGPTWYIDFPNATLVIGDENHEYKPLVRDRQESYSDMIHRIYDDEEREALAINSSSVKDITVQVTDDCNMACTYCYQHNKGHHSMTFDVAKKFIDMILDADERTNTYITSNKCKGAVINFIGGEPWMEVDLITKFSDYFMGELFRRKHPWAIRFCFSMSSNGLLHFDPKVQAYIRKHSKHFSYNISIDGNKELHDACRIDLGGKGTYDRAIKAVYDYRDTFGGVIGSKMTLSPDNVSKLSDAAKHMIDHDEYTQINLNCVYEEGWTVEHASILYKELVKLADWLNESGKINDIYLSIFDKAHGHPMSPEDDRNWCGGTGLMMAVDYKGDIYPCLRYMESSVSAHQPPFIIGNVDIGINKTETHCARTDCMACITRKSQSTEECFNCPIASGCGWCSAYNYEMYGTPNKRATFICEMHKARSLASVHYWSLRGEEYEMHCPEGWAIPIVGIDEYNRLKSISAKAGD